MQQTCSITPDCPLRLLKTAVALLTCLSLVPASINADSTAETEQNNEVALRQSRLAAKYEQLEMLMLKMAEFDAASNPARSDLLKKALGQSKDRHTRLFVLVLIRTLVACVWCTCRQKQKEDKSGEELKSFHEITF